MRLLPQLFRRADFHRALLFLLRLSYVGAVGCIFALSASANGACQAFNQISLSVDSPTAQVALTDGGIGYLGPLQHQQIYGFGTYKVFSAQGWASVVSTTYDSSPPGFPYETITLSFDLSGFPAGAYCAYFPTNKVVSGPAIIGQVACGGNLQICCPVPILYDSPQLLPFQLIGDACVSAPVTVGTANPLFEIDLNTTTPAPFLIDPVPNLVSGNATVTSDQLQQSFSAGRIVKGVAADGTTQVVVRIDTKNAGDQFAITLVDDQGLSGSSNIIASEDGALGLPGSTTISSSQLTVTAGSSDANGEVVPPLVET